MVMFGPKDEAASISIFFLLGAWKDERASNFPLSFFLPLPEIIIHRSFLLFELATEGTEGPPPSSHPPKMSFFSAALLFFHCGVRSWLLYLSHQLPPSPMETAPPPFSSSELVNRRPVMGASVMIFPLPPLFPSFLFRTQRRQAEVIPFRPA